MASTIYLSLSFPVQADLWHARNMFNNFVYNFCQAQRQLQVSTIERKSDVHYFFFFSFHFHFRKSSHFLFFPLCHVAYKSSHQCGCRCQAISLVQLRVSGPLLFRNLFSFFFFFSANIFAVVLHCFGPVSHGPGHIKLIVFMA